jgi:D-arabinose 1-dehydrogenase-like Zn-dependent alcohol dehydrogenase
MGGVDLILSTALSTEPAVELLDGLAAHGRLTLIGIDAGSVTIPAARLVMECVTVGGHLTGSPADIEQAMDLR